MKLSRIFMIAALGMAALLMITSPVANSAIAQEPTATPQVIVITATPQGAGDGSADTAVEATAAPAGDATPVPREFEALRAARAVLQKKIGGNLTYVTAWTWDLLLFPDSALGCPGPNDTPIAGETAGYKITIQPLGSTTVYELRVTYDLKQVFDCGEAGTAASGGTAPVGPIVNLGGFELGGHALDLSANTATIMKSAKMSWVKRQVSAGDGNGVAYIQQGKANGFKVLLSVIGDKGRVLDAGYQQEYANYVASLAAAGADAIEVWNEMNLDREWPNGQISGASYVQLLSKAYSAIKAAKSSTIVISGAPAPTGAAGPGGKTNGYWNDDVYMADMAAAGAGQFLDCVGLHYNEGIISPTQGSGDPRGGYPTYFFSSMLARGLASFPGKQACWTELGFLSPEGYGPLPAGFTWAADTSVAEQAQWLAEAAKASAASGRVKLMIVWNVDFPFYGADPVGGYAILRPGGGCPSCTALAGVMP
ncbi:MAG: hypothetical protein KF726_00245 [Anaerolineae bacterium]|nr:hypothetical protein [Anaerolineae bacterium]